MVEHAELGRDAMDRHAWAEAVEVFAAADAGDGLAADDLERLAPPRGGQAGPTTRPRRWNGPLPPTPTPALQPRLPEWR
jgi:hypothetical protein